MKIALVARYVHIRGGVPHYVAALAAALAPDHEVTIFSSGFEGLEDTGLRHRRVWAIGGGPILDITFSLGNSLLLLLTRLKKAGRFDIIHAHGDYCAFADVNSSHFCEAEEADRLDRGRQRADVTIGQRLVHRRKALLEKWVVSQSRGKPFIVLSERMRREFLSHYGSPEDGLYVIPGGTDSTRYSPANVPLYRDELRCRHSIAPTGTVVLFLGGDWERKGLPQAIKALARLRSPDVTLMVVGKGDAARYRELARRKRVEKWVIFAGHVEKTWEYFAASDMFLLPSLYEPFGLSVLEAMATGLPVVVGREAGVAELLRDGFDALLLEEARSVAEIATKLDLLIQDTELRRRLGQSARKTAVGYSWSRVAQRTVDVYRQARRN